MAETRILTCDTCRNPLMQIDFYGERLDGCLACNLWTKAGGAHLWRELPEDDVEALRGLTRPRPRPASGAR